MRPRAGGRSGRVSLLGWVTALLFLLPSAGPAAGAPAEIDERRFAARASETAPAHTDEGLAVELRAVVPAVAMPGEPVSLDLTVRNTGASVVTGVDLTAHLQPSAPLSRTAMAAWLRTDLTWRTPEVAAADVTTALAPGESRDVNLRVPAEAVPEVTATSWGPRGLLVHASADGGSDGGSDGGTGRAAEPAEGSLRTWLVLAPPEPVTPLPFTTVVPVTAGEDEVGAALEAPVPFEALAAQAAPRAAEVIAALDPQRLPGTTLAVDPLLLAPASTQDPGAQEQPVQGPDASAARDAAAALLQSVRPVADAGALVLLPQGDPDVAALAHAGSADHLLDATSTATRVAQEAGLQAPTDVLLAPGTVLDARTVAVAQEGGLRRLVGPSVLAPPAPPVGWTPAATSTVHGTPPDGEPVTMPAVLADTDLSHTVVGVLPPDPEASSASPLPVAEAQQLALATTAVIQRERPNDPRPLAVLLERRTTADPEQVDRLSAVLGSLAQAPWLSPTTLPALAAATTDPTERARLAPSQVADAELDPRALRTLDELLSATARLAAASPEPEALVDPATQRVRLLASTAGRAAPEDRDAAARRVREELRDLPDRVGVTASSTINLLATSGEVPVRVANDLPVPVAALVHLRAPDTRLTASGPVEVMIPARGETTAFVPVSAVGSGNIDVLAHLVTPQGLPLGEPVTMDVRLRADWEGRGAAIGGVVLLVLLAVGIVRTARRRRRRVDADPV